jgi:hypothetical protein
MNTLDFLGRIRTRASRSRVVSWIETRRGLFSQHDMDLANQAGASYRTDNNGALVALATLSSGTSAPSTTFAYMLWADTTTGLLKIRNAANTTWITVGTLAVENLGLLGPTLATEQATTSGTSKDFTGIPAGVKRITVMFRGVSTNGASAYLVQLGDSGGIETTGYLSGSLTSSFTTGFGIASGGAGDISHGSIVLSLENPSTFSWVASGAVYPGAGSTLSCAGSKSLSAELTQIRVTTVNGTDAFDAGAINISYE